MTVDIILRSCIMGYGIAIGAVLIYKIFKLFMNFLHRFVLNFVGFTDEQYYDFVWKYSQRYAYMRSMMHMIYHPVNDTYLFTENRETNSDENDAYKFILQCIADRMSGFSFRNEMKNLVHGMDNNDHILSSVLQKPDIIESMKLQGISSFRMKKRLRTAESNILKKYGLGAYPKFICNFVIYYPCSDDTRESSFVFQYESLRSYIIDQINCYV